MNNLFISYDLYSPGQNYEAVITVIKQLGDWAKVHKSCWYVKSKYSASETAGLIWAAMDSNDSLFVVDATNNNAAWRNLKPEVAKHIQDNWVSRIPA